jgi:CRISPR-associated protein Csm4
MIDVLRFQFISPVHIADSSSDYGKTEKIIHSDTIYSAIIQAWATLGLHEFIPKVGEDLNFCLSSLFPYTTSKNDIVYFFPKPYGFLKESDALKNSETRPDAKELKSVEFYDKDFLEIFLNQDEVKSYEGSIHGKFLTKGSINKDFVHSKVFPRVRVPKFGAIQKDKDGASKKMDTEIFYIERMFFQEGSGLFCMAHFNNEEIKNAVAAALNYLADEGIGTDRHVGNGLFKLQTDKINLRLNQFKSKNFTSLSLFLPKNKEQLQSLLSSNPTFELIKRGGWITSDPYLQLRKKSIFMFKEGSVFSFENGKKDEQIINIEGGIADIKPPALQESHPIFRVGKAMFLPVNI